MRENFNSLAVYEVRRLSVMVKKKKRMFHSDVPGCYV